MRTVQRLVALGLGAVLVGCSTLAGAAEQSTDPGPSPASAPPSPTPLLPESRSPQAVEWPAGSEFVLDEAGLGPLVLGAPLPTSSPSGALSECGAVAGVPPNVAVDLLDDGTVVRIAVSALLGDPDEVEVTTPHGLGIGTLGDAVLDAFGSDAEYREVALHGGTGEATEYRVDVDLGGSLLVFSLGVVDAGDPAPSAATWEVESIRLALPGYEDPPWSCA